MEGYSIFPALHGGFVVQRRGGEPGRFDPIAFAGNLDDCLHFLREVYGTQAFAAYPGGGISL